MNTILQFSCEYYFNSRNDVLFGAEIMRAMDEFGGKLCPLPEESLPFFVEWFLFHFPLFGKETPLQHFYTANPYNMSPESLVSCKRIIEENRYDFFEVVSVSSTRTIVRGVREEKEFAITDRDLLCARGDIFVTRLIPHRDEWTIASAASIGFHPVGKTDHRRLVSEFAVLDPRIVYLEIVAGGIQQHANPRVTTTSNGTQVVTAGEEQFDDGCAVCDTLRKAKQENRVPTEEELVRAFCKTNGNPLG